MSFQTNSPSLASRLVSFRDQSRRARHRSTHDGAALVEFAIVLPLLILFIQILMHIGWAFTQLTWVSQTAFHVAMIGSENPVNAGQGQMLARKDLLDTLQRRWMSGPLEDNLTYPNAGADRTVSVQLQGEVPAILWPISQALNVRLVSPVLVAGDGDVGNLNQFANPDDRYDCEGNVCTGGCPMGPCDPIIKSTNFFTELVEFRPYCPECG